MNAFFVVGQGGLSVVCMWALVVRQWALVCGSKRRQLFSRSAHAAGPELGVWSSELQVEMA